jgi:hypothetical protein
MGRPPVPPEESGDDDEFDDDEFDEFDDDTFEKRHQAGKSRRPLKKFRREPERAGPRPKRDDPHGRPPRREHRWDED